MNFLKFYFYNKRLLNLTNNLDKHRMGNIFFRNNSFEEKEMFLLKINGFSSKKEFYRSFLNFKNDERLNFLSSNKMPNLANVRSNFNHWLDSHYNQFFCKTILAQNEMCDELDLDESINYKDIINLYELSYGPQDSITYLKNSTQEYCFLSMFYKKKEKEDTLFKNTNKTWNLILRENTLESQQIGVLGYNKELLSGKHKICIQGDFLRTRAIIVFLKTKHLEKLAEHLKDIKINTTFIKDADFNTIKKIENEMISTMKEKDSDTNLLLFNNDYGGMTTKISNPKKIILIENMKFDHQSLILINQLSRITRKSNTLIIFNKNIHLGLARIHDIDMKLIESLMANTFNDITLHHKIISAKIDKKQEVFIR